MGKLIAKPNKVEEHFQPGPAGGVQSDGENTGRSSDRNEYYETLPEIMEAITKAEDDHSNSTGRVERERARDDLKIAASLIKRSEYGKTVEFIQLRLDKYGESHQEYASLIDTLGDAYCRMEKHQLAKEQYKKEYRLGMEKRDDEIKRRAAYNLGRVYARTGKNDEASKCFQHYLKNASQFPDKTKQKKALDAMGEARFGKGLEQEIQCFLDYVKKSLEGKDYHGVIFAIGSLGNVALKLRNQDLAKKFFDAEQRIAEIMGCPLGEMLASIDLARLCIAKEEFPDAIVLYNKGLLIAEEINNEYGQRQANSALGDIYRCKKSFAIAIQHYERQKEIAERREDEKGQAEANRGLAEVYYAQKKYSGAKKCFEALLEMGTKIDGPYKEAFAMMRIAQIFLKWKKGKQAESNFREFEDHLDCIDNNKIYVAWARFVRDFEEDFNQGMDDYVLILAQQHNKRDESLEKEEKRRRFCDLSQRGRGSLEETSDRDPNRPILIELRILKDQLRTWVIRGSNRTMRHFQIRHLSNGEFERIKTWMNEATFTKFSPWGDAFQEAEKRTESVKQAIKMRYDRGRWTLFSEEERWNIWRDIEGELYPQNDQNSVAWQGRIDGLYRPRGLGIDQSLFDEMRQSATDFIRIMDMPEPRAGDEFRIDERFSHRVREAFIEEADSALQNLSNLILSRRVGNVVRGILRDTSGAEESKLVRDHRSSDCITRGRSVFFANTLI